MTPIRVFLVDDQDLVRAGFAMIVGAAADMTVVGSVGDGRSALAALRRPEQHCDVVLMDVTMPGLDGIETTRRLLAEPGAPRVVMLTTFDSDDNLVASLRAGASGFLSKDAGPEELLAAVRAAATGDAPVAPRLVRRLIDLFVLATPEPRPAPPPGLDRLTPREREILSAVGLGLSNAEIAGRLHLSESTVKTHLGSVLRKLGLRDRVQAVVAARLAGLAG
ncbi:response regulator [Micromonospora echinofusca]|uniref:Response regulator n=1 Tax=Micromonospora echinofusca TaxID=47858 RepID=A0ABS3VZK2_MICEH|nr:response regulator transcription factor [Micromonospora echinofusca]MBO4209778.1 response regulator [Micromonospora echinofusca]